MSRSITYNCTAILLFLVSSCSVLRQSEANKMNSEQYTLWHNSHQVSLRDTVFQNGVYYYIEQIPLELEIVRNIRTNRMTQVEAEEAYNEERKKSNIRYQLVIELPTVGSDIFSYNPQSGQTNRASYFSFDMRKDIYLISENKDTIECNGFMYERGLSNFPRANFIVDFSSIAPNQVIAFGFRDRFLSESNVQFNLKHFQSVSIPQLTF